MASLKAWGKLIPISPRQQPTVLYEDRIIIGRGLDCQIRINEKRLSGKHCLIEHEGSQCYLTDLSTNGTYLFSTKLPRDSRIELKKNSQIWLLPISRVSQQESIGFRFEQIVQKLEEPRSADVTFVSNLRGQIQCAFCCDIMVYPVCIQPCNHRLCGPCLTELVLKKKGNCITCRKQITTAARDSLFASIIDDYLRTHPEEKRTDEDDAPNIFGHQPTDVKAIILGKDPEEEPVLNNTDKLMEQEASQLQPPPEVDENVMVEEEEESKPKKGKKKVQGQKKEGEKKKRTPRKTRKSFISSDISASTDSQEEMEICSECKIERNGFRCKSGQAHVNCHNCGKVFAVRGAVDKERSSQSCEICSSYFCNLYFGPCQVNGPKLERLASRRSTLKLEPLNFRNNKVEFDAFKNLLAAEKMSLGNMFDQIIGLAEQGRFEFQVDRRLMRTTPVEQRRLRLNRKTCICDNCWRELWFQMIVTFRRENSDHLPESIKKRPNCYWGVNCRTMEHNLEHAKKYNHMEPQCKF